MGHEIGIVPTSYIQFQEVEENNLCKTEKNDEAVASEETISSEITKCKRFANVLYPYTKTLNTQEINASPGEFLEILEPGINYFLF